MKEEKETQDTSMQTDPPAASRPVSSGYGDGKFEYEEAFEKTGHGCFNYIATLTCSLIFIHAMIEMVAIAYVITPAECDLKLTVGQKSAVNSAVFVGIMVTAICWGVLGDLYGRRKIMLPALVGAVICSFASSLCSGFWVMMVFRFLTGCLVSASSAMVLVYLAELQTNQFRDRSISIAITGAQINFILLPGFAWAIIPGTWSINVGSLSLRPWRVFMWLWGLVGLTGAILLFILPESPRFIVAAKGPDKALPILAKIYAWNTRTKADLFPVKTIEVTHNKEEEGTLRQNLLQLMKAPIRRCVILTHAAMFITILLANGLYIWIPDFLNAALEKSSSSISMCVLISEKYTKRSDVWGMNHMPIFTEPRSAPGCKGEINTMMYPLSMGVELFYLVPFAAVIIIIDKYSKVKLYAVIMFACAAGVLLSSIIPQCMVAFAFLVLGLACGSCCCILTALAVDAFPTSLRGLATCTMYMLGQLGACVGTSIIGIMNGWACYLIFAILTAFTAGSAVALIFLWPNIAEVRKTMEAKHFAY